MSTAVFLSPSPILSFLNNAGQPNAGGSILTQVGGVNYPTYQDVGGNTPLPNPIPLNSRGEISNSSGISSQLFLANGVTYTFTQFDANGNQINQALSVGPNGVQSTDYSNGNLNRVVSSIAGLRALAHSSYASAFVTGYYAAHDGGGGPYQYDSGDTTSADNGGTIIVANDGGRWKLQHTDAVSVKQFGAKGDGITDDTAAITAAIAYITSYTYETNCTLCFPPGEYAVTSITFAYGPTYDVIFDGAQILGIAKTTTDAIVTLQMEGSNIYGLDVNGNFNTNYTCMVRWYNATASSQYNSIFGLKMKYGVRGMIYGVNAGSSDTGYAQSENSVYGWRTRGVQNPLLMNHSEGFLNLVAPQLVCGNEEWAGHPSVTFNWTVGRAFECVNGWLYVSGGEVEKAGSSLGFAADCSNLQMVNVNIETACPMQLVGPPSGAPSPSTGVNLSNCRHLMTTSGQSQWAAASALQADETLSLENCQFARPNGTGAFDRTPMIDVSAAATNPPAVYIDGGYIQEWAFLTVGTNCPLVKGTLDYRYRSVRLQQTAADSNIYQIDNTLNNLLENRTADILAYSQTGWYNNTDSGSTSVSVNASGPIGYNASSLGISATGVARIISANEPGGTATLKATAFIVRPGELYSLEGWLNYLGGTNFHSTARFYNSAGSLLSEQSVSDQNAMTGTAWSKVMGLIQVPANAYYMAVGVLSSAANGQFTDLRLRRAS